jgi:hypothetical protein
VPSYDIVSVGSMESGYRALCGQCFNTEMAKLDGLDRFEHFSFEAVQLAPFNSPTALGRITNAMRRGLSVKHVSKGEHGLQIADHRVVRGMIEWDESQDGSVPLLNVDGREIPWQEFGRMLMRF